MSDKERPFEQITETDCGCRVPDGDKPEVPVRWADEVEERLKPERNADPEREVCLFDEKDQRRRYLEVLEPLLERAVDRRINEERMELVFEPGPQLLRAITAFVDVERRCCPFAGFELEIEAGGGPIRLKTEMPGDFEAGPMDEILHEFLAG